MRMILVVLLIAVLALFTQRKKAPKAITAAIAVLVAAILALLGWDMTRGSGPPTGMVEEFHEAAGWKLGTYIAELHQDGGEVVVMHATTREGTPVASAPLQLAGLKKAFEGTSLLVTPMPMSFADAHVDPMMMGGPVARNDAFLAAVESASGAAAVILPR